MKVWVIFGAVIFGIWAYSDYSKQQRKDRLVAEEAACQANPICRNEKANQDARFQSILGSSPVRSSTGRIYFKGDACTGDCSGHILGYQWAEERGISKDDGCTGYSLSFIEGCWQYVSERVAELEEGKEESDQYDDRESCTPGRYGDC